MRKIKVYSKPNCAACDFTKMWLDDHGIEYEAIDAYEDEQAMEDLRKHRFMSFPVVAVGSLDEAWAGIDIERLEELLDE